MGEVKAPPRRKRAVLRSIAIGVVALLVVAVVSITAFRNRLALVMITSAVHGLGYHLQLTRFDLSLQNVVADDINVTNLDGEPVATIGHVAVRYSLRDLLPGGDRLFGLMSVQIIDPHLTLIHHADGSYNVTLPQQASSKVTPTPAPLNVSFAIAHGQLVVIDRFVQRLATDRADTPLMLTFGGSGAISPASGSRYHVVATLRDIDGQRYPFAGNARFEDARGYSIQHWTAARLPIAELADFALNTHALRIDAGMVQGVDVKVGSLPTASGPLQAHLTLAGRLARTRVYVAALTRPIEDAHGAFVVNDDGATLQSLSARVGGIALTVRGALYDYASLQLGLAVKARGELAQARALWPDSAKLPVSGALNIDGLVEGPAARPMLFARIAAAHTSYAAFRFDALAGFAALSQNRLDLIAGGVRYGPVRVAARGSVILARHTQTVAYAHVMVPADGLPYAGHLIPGMLLSGITTVSGPDAKLQTHGYLTRVNGPGQLELPFALSAAGDSTVGPVVVQRRDGASIYARARSDRRKNQIIGFADVRDLKLLPAPNVTLPGLVVPRLPPKLDVIVDATLAGLARGGALRAVEGHVRASGPWGEVHAAAVGDGARYAARGRLTSTFERLAAFVPLQAQGPINLPFTMFGGGKSTVVQIPDARFAGAQIRGVALQRLVATFGITGQAIQVYDAEARIAGSDVTAQGRFGDGGRVQVTAGAIDLEPLHTAGLPLLDGHATLLADIGGTYARPTANLSAALADAHDVAKTIGGHAHAAYDGSSLFIQRATLMFGGAYADASGTVAGLSLGHIAPRFALRANVADADVARLLQHVQTPLRYPQGTLAATALLHGSATAPLLTGDVTIVEGELNGLALHDAHVGFVAGLGGFQAQNGRVTIGATTLRFSAAVTRAGQRAHLRAAPVNLADFNDYFDAADVLAGKGRLDLGASLTRDALLASADVALGGVRYRRFELGRIAARVRTTGSRVALSGDVAGGNGEAYLSGDVGLPRTDVQRDILRRSLLNVHGGIAGLNLGNVLPLAGFDAPLLGTLQGSAIVRGRYPDLTLRGQVALQHGVFGRAPIERFSLRAQAQRGRGQLTLLDLAIPGLTANASGSFGLRPSDAFDLRLHAASPDLRVVLSTALGHDLGVTGMLDTSARLTGTAARPALKTVVDLSKLAYRTVTVPALHAAIVVTRRTVEVQNGRATLSRDGSIGFDGSLPLWPRGDGATTPIALDFTPHHVDVAPYASIISPDTRLAGTVDGNVGVRGTLGKPQLTGSLGFHNGAYASSIFTGGVSAVDVDLLLAGTTVQIANLHVGVGHGSIDGSGTLGVLDLRDPIRGVRADITLAVNNARIAAPKFYVGNVNGTLSAHKLAGKSLIVGGALAFSSARIPYTALIPSGATSATATSNLPDVGLALGITLGHDVRIASGPVDIGAIGAAQLAGTLGHPTLDGQFTATDGTVSLYRTFVVQNGSLVAFDPTDGVTPTVDATAVTNVPDPPTSVLLHITGPATHLNLDFSSEPAYSREQILGLLVNAQALGAVAGLAQTGTSAAPVSISGIGSSVLAGQFTQRLLQPFSTALGQSLGLSDFTLDYSATGTISTSARRKIAKNVSFVYGASLGTMPRTSVGVTFGNTIAGAQLIFYQVTGAQTLGLTPALQSNFLAASPPNYTLEASEPSTGSGFVFTYARHFW